jgi:hypothetical protein
MTVQWSIISSTTESSNLDKIEPVPGLAIGKPFSTSALQAQMTNNLRYLDEAEFTLLLDTMWSEYP